MSTFERKIPQWDIELTTSEINTFHMLWKIDRDKNFRLSARLFSDDTFPDADILMYEEMWNGKYVGRWSSEIDTLQEMYYLVFYLRDEE